MNIIGSTVSGPVMSAVLAEFAKEAQLGPRRRAVVVLDGAGWHTTAKLKVPDGVHLLFLPPYSPELQPAERLWPIVNEGVANRTFETLPDLITGVQGRLRHMDEDREAVRRKTASHWCPKEPTSAV